MKISLIKTFLILLISFIAGIDSILDELQIYRPIILCPIIGYILNNSKLGFLIGSIIEIINLNSICLGTSISLDLTLPSIVTTIYFILNNNISIKKIITLSVILSLLGQFISVLTRIINVFIQSLTLKYSNDGNIISINNLHIISMLIQGLKMLILTLLFIILINLNYLNLFINNIPEYFFRSINIINNILSLFSISIIINSIKNRNKFKFLILGFIISLFLYNFNFFTILIIYIIFSTIFYFKDIFF